MKFFEKLFQFLIEPIKTITNRNLAEKTSMFFSKHKGAIYVLSFLLTALIIYINYN